MTAPPTSPTRPLKRSMGLWMATALVVGNMVGSGIFTPAGAARRRGGPGVDPVARLHGRRRDAARARLRQPRPRPSADRRAVLLRTPRVRRLRRLPDSLGVLDRRLGRQRRYRGRLRRLPRRVLGRRQDVELARRARRGRRRLAVHAREHPRRPRDRRRAGRDDRAEVRAARRDRHRRALLHEGRQLHAVHAGERRLRLAHQRRGDARPLGVHRPRVGDGAGGRGEGPRADDSAGDDSRHARDDGCSTSSRSSRSSASSRRRRWPARRRRSPTPRTRSGAARSSASPGASGSRSSRSRRRSAR